MKKILYDAGYGNQKPLDFLKRLKDVGITLVLDVRREKSRSWTARYNTGDCGGMAMLMYECGILYVSQYLLGNEHDTLAGYKRWLETKSVGSYLQLISQSFRDRWGADQVCLVCCERHAYKDGEVNCHRKYVADALVKLLGPEWEVQHI